ncbi:MAG: sensor histidine kinase [Gammaproteobacteria bacterium]|nr:sensor histidine kinase [Gammaproteobacteria bacterium]
MNLSNTLSFRLLLGSGVWILTTLALSGLLLVLLFRQHVERQFDAVLGDHFEELVAASEISDNGEFYLTWKPSDPRFNRPYSGWYWQVLSAGTALEKSASLWTEQLPVVTPEPGAGSTVQELTGPTGITLRALVEPITLPGSEDSFSITIAGPLSSIGQDVSAFASKLIITMAFLAVGLIGALLVQIRFGLRPLSTLQLALADIRAGKTQRLPQSFPGEVQPVVNEVNSLLDHSEQLIERARTQSGNLAHALKNPLTVIRNEAARVSGESGRVLREQTALISNNVNRYLSQARAAGSAGKLGARADVEKAVGDLVMVMQQLYGDRHLDIQARQLARLCFRGDEQDLEEMLGNLMDNACKWANKKVLVHGKSGSAGQLLIIVEDDGPGIPEQSRVPALQRGQRLDAKVPGSGLGLSIVRDLVTLYRGDVRLAHSTLGGLKVTLVLPAAI